MKCQACNAPLSIEDEKCPYCGTPNPDAIRHRQDMRTFSGEFQRTRFSVLKTTRENAQKYIRIVIICVMIVLLILSFLFVGFSWDIASAVSDWKASANSKEYCAILDQYEEEGDFLSFVAFYEQKSLYGVKEFEQYRHVYSAASNYKYIYQYLMTLMEEEHWEGGHEDAIKYLCDSIDYYYEYLDREHYDFYEESGAYKEVHLDAVDRMTEKIEGLLTLCLDIPEEEMNAFRELSSAEKQVLIERSYKEYE